MASYAALSSLMQTIDSLLNSSHISILENTCKKALEFAYNEIKSLQDAFFALDYYRSGWGYRGGGFDAFEQHFSNHFPSEYQIILFAEKEISPLQHLVSRTKSAIINNRTETVDGQTIGGVIHKLEDFIQSLESTFRKSPMFSERMEENIHSFTQSLVSIKEYSTKEGTTELGVVRGEAYPRSAPSQFEETEKLSFGKNKKITSTLVHGVRCPPIYYRPATEPVKTLLEEFGKIGFEFLGFKIFAEKVLEEVLRRLKTYRSNNSEKKLNDLDGQIRDATHNLEDVLECYISDHFFSNNISNHLSTFYVDLQGVNGNIVSFTQSLKKLKEGYMDELFNLLPADDVGDDDVPSRIDFGANKLKMVGFSDEYGKIRDQLSQSSRYDYLVVSLFGMAGIWKTTLAKKIFTDPSIVGQFHHRVWVTVGQKFKLEKVRRCILAQVRIDDSIHEILREGDEKLVDYWHESLKRERFFIVLDDVWEKDIGDIMQKLFRYEGGRNGVLVTTRLRPNPSARISEKLIVHEMRFMNKEESWDLLREKVFGDRKACPPQLVNAEKLIAENCEGLPLTLVTVADLLLNAEKTLEFWNKLAEKNSSIYTDAYDQMSNVLRPSYDYLAKDSQAFFLYMGVFPQKYEIKRAELLNLWIGEGFVNRSDYFGNLDRIIKDLADSSLLMTSQKRSTDGIKIRGLHSSLWHLCKREAGDNKFFHVINSYKEGLAYRIKSQRRLCIHNNILFSIKDVHESMASISTARSLLCLGPHHQYPVPVCFGLKLLRVLNALQIRFYEFPIEVVELVQLRYLALTCYGNLPCSISKLWNLKFLIVCRYFNIKTSKSPSYLPKEIWDMKELMHLQIMESKLPDPCGACLPNLSTLLDASPHSCTKSVLEGLPNLVKLGIRIELTPDSTKPLTSWIIFPSSIDCNHSNV